MDTSIILEKKNYISGEFEMKKIFDVVILRNLETKRIWRVDAETREEAANKALQGEGFLRHEKTVNEDTNVSGIVEIEPHVHKWLQYGIDQGAKKNAYMWHCIAGKPGECGSERRTNSQTEQPSE